VSALGDKDVSGLYVAVDNALVVGCLKRIRNFDTERKESRGLQWLSGNAVIQRHSIEVLHHNERLRSTRRRRSSGVPIYVPTAEAMRTTSFGPQVFLRSGTGLLPVRLNLLVSIGTVDLLTLYGGPLGPLYPVVVYSAAVTWLLVMLGLGFAGRSGQRWAFLVGMALYATDMIALILTFYCGHSGFMRFSSSNGSRDKRR
jgi:hypothetical protein